MTSAVLLCEPRFGGSSSSSRCPSPVKLKPRCRLAAVAGLVIGLTAASTAFSHGSLLRSGHRPTFGVRGVRGKLVMARGLHPQSQQERFSSRGPINLAFDGLDDLEEEEEPLPESEVATALTIVPKSELGEGLAELERLHKLYRDKNVEPELSEDELMELHASLIRDLPRCPSVSTVAWCSKALEQMELEDDDVFEVLAEELKLRIDKMEPQNTMDAVNSFGNIYWIDTDLLASFADLIRRQMKFFTTIEVVKLANSMSRMGGTDNLKHVGMFFEMRSRVNLPMVDKFIKEKLGRDAAYYDNNDEERDKIFGTFDLPKNSKLKGKGQAKLKIDLGEMKRDLLGQADKEELERADGWKAGGIAELFGDDPFVQAS